MTRLFRSKELICIVVLLVSNIAFADSKSAAIDAFSRVSEVRNVAISPTGARIAYQRIEKDNNLILVLDVVSGKPVTSLGIDDSDIDSLRFVGDATLMIVFDQRYRDTDFGRSYRRRIRFLDLESGDIDNFGGWTPGGWDMNRSSTRGTVVGISEDFARLSITMREGNADLYSLFDYSIDYGASNLAHARGTSDTLDWFVDDGGNPLVRVDFDEDDDLYTIFTYRDGEPEILFQEQVTNPQMRVVALTPQRDGLVYTARLPGSDEMTAHVLSLADGSRSTPVFSFGNGGILVDSERRAIAFRRTMSVTDEYEFLSPDAGRFFKAIQDSMPGERVQLVSYTNDFEHVVVRLSRKWGDSYYLLFSKSQQKPVLIAKETTGAPNDDVQFDYNYEITARDGRLVRARLTYRGEPDEQKKKPLIILSGAPTWVEQYFAARGYVIAQPYPRDLHMRRSFIPEDVTLTAGQLHTDINDTVKNLVDKGMVDPDKVCVLGFYRGAYAAALAAAESPGRYRCFASFNGYFDLERLAGRVRERSKDDSYRVRFFEAQYGVDASDKDSLRTKSPLNHVGDNFPPTLLMYFKKSDKVLEGQAKDLGRKLESNNREHRIKSFNTDDLAINEQKTRRQILTELSGFVEERL